MSDESPPLEAPENPPEVVDTANGTVVNLGSTGPTDLVWRPQQDAPIRIDLAGGGIRDMAVSDVIAWIASDMPQKKALVFLYLCQRAGVDPLSDEVCVYKQTNEYTMRSEWHMLIRQQAWRRLACQHPDCQGYEFSFEGDPDNPPTLIGHCKVHRRGWSVAYVETVRWKEAASKIGKGGKPYLPTGGYCWSQPLEFLRGVTETRALRHVFADRFGRVYSPEEFGKPS